MFKENFLVPKGWPVHKCGEGASSHAPTQELHGASSLSPSGGPRPTRTCCRPHAEQKPPSQLPPPALRDVTISSKSAQQWPTALLAKQAQQPIPYLTHRRHGDRQHGVLKEGASPQGKGPCPAAPSHTATSPECPHLSPAAPTPPAPCSQLTEPGLRCREGTSFTRHPDSHA